MAVDCSTRDFLQVLRRFFAIRGQPAVMIGDNGSQFVAGAERELGEMVRGLSREEIQDFCAEKDMHWKFTTPAVSHQNGCAEALVRKTCKNALKRTIGSQVLTQFELYTVFLEVANLANQRPIGWIPNDPDDGKYICPNDIQGPFKGNTKSVPQVEFVQKIVDSFWKRWESRRSSITSTKEAVAN
ncbi:uncharacterized protein [Montipora capricornis]|uniref:uncharacterized protein n=1 Tax=Montipora capricornis TaxID=246305 RepID=UPI0035F12DB3